MPTTLTKTLIATHERLYPRVAALLKQVERVAGRQPGMGVPEESVRLARELCRETAKLLGKDGRGIGLAKGSAGAGKGGGLDHATLAVALGQALAGLEAFEVAHSGWSTSAKCTVWELDGPARPVARLLPPGSEGKPVETRNPESDGYRRELYKLIMGRYAAGYDAGYKDAREGTPPRADYCERVWDALVDKEGGVEEARKAGLKPPRIRYSNPPRHLIPEGSVPGDPRERRSRW